MRMQQWDRVDNCYYMDEYEKLITSSALFARKFSGEEGERVIERILENRAN